MEKNVSKESNAEGVKSHETVDDNSNEKVEGNGIPEQSVADVVA